MNIGYIRVSSQEQNISRQMEELKKYGINERYIFIDKISGTVKANSRPNYEAMKLVLRSGDSLYVHELDRLGRNKEDITNELRNLKEMGVIVRVLDIPTTLTTFESNNEFSSLIMDMVNNLLIEVMATMAEADVKKIKKRQLEGIQAAKQKGVKFGRPSMKITEEFIEAYHKWKHREEKPSKIIQSLNMKPSSFYKLKNTYEKQIEKI